MDNLDNKILANFLFLINQKMEENLDMQSSLVSKLYDYNPNAFLVALILDQGVKAEKVWQIPPFGMELDYNHLNVYTLEQLKYIVGLSGYRYPNRAAEQIYASIKHLCSEYGGKAVNIWNKEMALDELAEKLMEFSGIGPKKSSLAVNLLVRDIRVVSGDKSKIDVAYDIHLRRVFLRSGIAQLDDRNHMIQCARELLPEYPAAMDIPTWYIGRDFCHNTNPNCIDCYITNLCAKRIENMVY